MEIRLLNFEIGLFHLKKFLIKTITFSFLRKTTLMELTNGVLNNEIGHSIPAEAVLPNLRHFNFKFLPFFDA